MTTREEEKWDTCSDEYTENLISAIRMNNIDEIRRLHELGTNLDAIGSSGKTPLYLASCYNYPHLVSLLIELGAHVDSPDCSLNFCFTPIYIAAMNGSQDVIRVLVNADASFRRNILDEVMVSAIPELHDYLENVLNEREQAYEHYVEDV
uniref:Ankyrin repeat containing protein n=1 Tax=Megaviridae environmental sample TaxID=1737588 RepID=A0A5J6VHW5_9VIRU|nr:MAG: ankyrin repeat containing protein [Megaviridae environmental sample]